MTGGRIVVLSAPSGSGKGTVIRKLLTMRCDVSISVSYASRPPREGEADGKHYYFVTRSQFNEMIINGDFVEWDRYQGDYYGTSKEKIQQLLDRRENVIFDITIKGAYAIREHFPHAALVFLLPPSFGELERRLRARGTESDEKIKGRLTEARREIAALENFDYYIINNDVAEAARQLSSIFDAEKCRMREGEAKNILNSFH